MCVFCDKVLNSADDKANRNTNVSFIIIGSGEKLELVWGSKTCSELKNIQSEIWRINLIS